MTDPFTFTHDTPSSPIPIQIDDREQTTEIADILRADPAFAVSSERLNLGDYRIDHRLLVERKTVSDFALSLVDGRLFDQASRLVQNACRPFMIVEGPPASEVAITSISRAALLGAWVSLTLIFNIHCLRTYSARETAQVLRSVGLQFGGRHRATPVRRVGYRPHRRRRRQLFVLQGLPGVGPHRAEQLLQALGSIEAVMTADLNTLAQIGGIGPATAQAIRELVGSDPAESQ